MNKKILSLVLALVMVLGTFTSVFAEAKTTEAKKDEAKVEKIEKVVGKQNKIDYIRDKKIVEGDEKGNLNLDSNVKRSEITKVLVIANGEEEAAKNLQGVGGVYKDLKADHWANGYIVAGTTRPAKNGVKMLNGYPDNTFKADGEVTYAELAKMLVVLAKNDLTVEKANNAKWYEDWINWAQELGIFADVNVTDYNKAANRADTFTMLYNALYRMKEFKRVPSNEVRGIVSSLSSGKLVLNQDSKKEYTVNNETVIVTGDNSRRQIVRVNSLNNLDVYLGSLVRILVNDKNEVTHVIELGNPKELARGTEANKITDGNNIWKGVADNTVETDYYADITSLYNKDKKVQALVNKGYAKVELNGTRTKANAIKFVNKDAKVVADLAIDNDTEVYVANPYNNIMKKVANVNEALSLIGFNDYKEYKIPNVYAAFDTTGYKSAIKGYETTNSTAKVIVFNVVAKDAGGAKYRLLESASSAFNSTVENTDGKVMNINDVLNKAHFALEYGDKYDVVERRGDAIKTLINHNDYTNYPMVRVLDILKNNTIIVEDRFRNEAPLYLGDADIFNAKQYKELAIGDYLQFNTEKRNMKVSEVSLFTDRVQKDYAAEMFNDKRTGSVLNIVDGIEQGTAIGTVKVKPAKVNPNGEAVVEINVETSTWRPALNNKTVEFKVSEANFNKIQEGTKYTFQIKDYKYENTLRAYGFELAVKNVKQTEKDLEEALVVLTEQKEKAEAIFNITKVDEIKKVSTREEAIAMRENIVKYNEEAQKLLEAEKLVNELQKALGKSQTEYTQGKKYTGKFKENRAKAFNKIVEQKQFDTNTSSVEKF